MTDHKPSKKAIVVGASRGIGRAVAADLAANGTQVLAIARDAAALDDLAAGSPNITALAADAADPATAVRAYDALDADLVIIAAGATPHMAPVHEHDWQQFSRNWQTDVRITFEFATAALRRPLPPGATVLTLSSGAGIGGSPASGGYSGAKRMQMFLTDFCQKEAGRLGRDLRFVNLVPQQMLPATDTGQAAVAGYAKYLGISPAEFAARFDPPLEPAAVATAVRAITADPAYSDSTHFSVTGKGFQPLEL